MNIICSSCDAPNPVGTLFCLGCGIELLPAAIDDESTGSVVAFPEEDLDLIEEVMNTPWVHQITVEDLRFENILPFKNWTIGETLFDKISEYYFKEEHVPASEFVSAIREIQSEIERISFLSLDQALSDYLSQFRSINLLQGAKFEMILARFAWSGSPKITFERAGSMVGVSRQRVDQIEKTLLRKLPKHRIFMPQLDKALELIAGIAPVKVNEGAKKLKDSGIASIEFNLEGLLLAAEVFGRTPTFRIEERRRNKFAVVGEDDRHADILRRIAFRQVSMSTCSNIEEVVAEVIYNDIEVSVSKVRRSLSIFPEIEYLEGDWFWFPESRSANRRLTNVTRKMLSVASPIHVLEIRDGLNRVIKHRVSGFRNRTKVAWSPIVPPRSVLKCLYENHPDFHINDSGMVSHVGPLDYACELGQNERIMVDVIRSSPAVCLDRQSLVRECLARGVNEGIFNMLGTFSPVIKHLGRNIWSLQGVKIDSAVVEALRRSNALRPRQRRVLDHGWTSEGWPWVAVRIPAPPFGSFVFNVPKQIKEYIAGRDFTGTDEFGKSDWKIRVSPDGIMVGSGPFLVRSGAEEGDIFIVEFDLLNRNAVLRLGNDDSLHEISPTT